MGWAYGELSDGREVGYGVEATCDQDGCDAKIDRGLGYICGEMHGQDDETGCGKYFCDEHLLFGGPNQMCSACIDAWEESDHSDLWGDADEVDDD